LDEVMPGFSVADIKNSTGADFAISNSLTKK
jgi:acyl CoA:acetate/3-ketoacid CoA transferase beta subunit